MSILELVVQRGRWGALAALALLAVERRAVAWSSSCESAQRFTLPNGVQAVLVPEAALPTVALVSSVHVGFRNDPPGREGLAHYVEHLTFRGAPPFTPVFDLYEEFGAIGVNATTSADTTNYFALVPAAQLERAIWIEARRLAIGVNTISEDEALAERRVLLREHELRSGYAPAHALLEATYAALYPAEHPYHSSFDSEDSIGQLTLGDARWFVARHYRTDQTRLVLVGDFVPEAARQLIERHFGALDAPVSPIAADPVDGECSWAKKPRALAERRIVQHTRYRNERLELFWPVAPDEQPETLRGLFNAMHGELTEAMRQTGLSHQVTAELVALELGSFWVIQIEVAPGQPFEKIEPLVARVLAAAPANFASEHDLVAKRQALELSDQLERDRLLGRALELAQRECTPTPCIDRAKYFTASALGRMDRFSLADALIVERRFSRAASEDGDLEVVK
jgi:secreted Zn-dependent insulinase-like peptidase